VLLAAESLAVVASVAELHGAQQLLGACQAFSPRHARADLPGPDAAMMATNSLAESVNEAFRKAGTALSPIP
jgi:hypothetical protein